MKIGIFRQRQRRRRRKGRFLFRHENQYGDV